MEDQQKQLRLKDWHVLADRFILSDFTALSQMPESVTDQEIQYYLYTFHDETFTLDEIQAWRRSINEKDTLL